MNILYIIIPIILFMIVRKIIIELKRLKSPEHTYHKISMEFRAIASQDPLYSAFDSMYDQYLKENSYSAHCGSIRDGSEADRQFNIQIDKKVDYLKKQAHNFAETHFSKYLNEIDCPSLKYIDRLDNSINHGKRSDLTPIKLLKGYTYKSFTRGPWDSWRKS